MNTAQAKLLSLPDLMSRLGYEPVKTRKGGHELWYKSPFRNEEEASFVTSYIRGKWIWKDFGDIGGTVVDFAMRHENTNSVKEALTFLSYMFQGHLFEKTYSNRVGEIKEKPMEQASLFSFNQQGRAATPNFLESKELEFLDAQAIHNPIIHDYLEKERGIPAWLADLYLVEVRYRNTTKGKDYFAFGMKNESGGYEIRAASSQFSFKSALNGRDITLIRGQSPGRRAVNVFEGMTDFLSLLVMMGTRNLSGDSIIMHSLSSFPRAVEVIRGENYQTINTFLDNDTSGQQGLVKFQETFPDIVKSQSDLYAPYQDVNEALMANRTSNFRIGS